MHTAWSEAGPDPIKLSAIKGCRFIAHRAKPDGLTIGNFIGPMVLQQVPRDDARVYLVSTSRRKTCHETKRLTGIKVFGSCNESMLRLVRQVGASIFRLG
jgi:hypothetical protein